MILVTFFTDGKLFNEVIIRFAFIQFQTNSNVLYLFANLSFQVESENFRFTFLNIVL